MFSWRRHPVSDSDLSAHLDGELGVAARARLEAHVSACAACRRTLNELRVVRQALRGLPRAAASRSFALREADVRTRPAASGAWLLRAQPALAGVTTVAFVAFWVLVGVDLTRQPSESVATKAPSGVASGLMQQLDQAGREGQPAAPQLGAESTPGAQTGAPVEGGRGALATIPAPWPSPEATTAAAEAAKAGGGGGSGLRAAEAATAALALFAGGSLALVWRRRRT